MTKDEAIKALGELGDDNEIAHCEADDILIEFLRDNNLSDVAEAWEAVSDKCGGFWYA